jgi:sugar lactone lactonase YvrE
LLFGLGVTLALVGCGGGSAKTASSSSSAAVSASTGSSSSGSSTTTTAKATGQRGLTGIVSPIVGSGSDDGKGIPGLAATASLGSHTQYAVAANGNLYVTNGSLNVYKVSGNQVTVFAPLDPPGGPGSGGVAVSPDGSLIVVTPSNVLKFAADGTSTLLLNASAAGLSTSLGPVAVDHAGNVFVADGTRRITRIGIDGTVSPFAGTGAQAAPDSAAGDGGPATAAPLGAPTQLAFDANDNLYIADSSAHRVRRVAADGTITTVAGGGATSLLGGTEAYPPDGTKATDLKLADVSGVAVDGKGRVYVADDQSRAIFRFGADGGIELVLGDQTGGLPNPGLPANATRATTVAVLAVDAKGDLLYLEKGVVHSIAGAGA